MTPNPRLARCVVLPPFLRFARRTSDSAPGAPSAGGGARFPAAASLAVAVTFLSGCANFKALTDDLKLVEENYLIQGHIKNARDYEDPVQASVIEWDPATGDVYSGDQLTLEEGGRFGFHVKSPVNQYVAAWVDHNGSKDYEPGEPLWIHSDATGKPIPAKLDGRQRAVELSGRVSSATRAPRALLKGIEDYLAGRTIDEVITHEGINFAVGQIADLDEERFAAGRGEEGLWTPEGLAIKDGFGIYFLEPYDPDRVPVIFVHGAAGSPQDWRPGMNHINKRRYQAWFYFYPTGARLSEAAEFLDLGVTQLHERYGFERLDVVAHSMGGLVAREFVLRNAIERRQGYIRNFVTFSTPWNGHEAAAMGVRWAPEVVPSWYDMETGSDFLTRLYRKPLRGTVNHHLVYSHKASDSMILPDENDGTVSVASELRPEAKADAVSIDGYDETHVSILSSRAALRKLESYLDQPGR